MRRTTGGWLPAAALFATLTLAPTSSPACPNCKEAVAAQPDEAEGVARGYNWSVLYMMATPFALLGTGAFLVARAARRGGLPEL